MSADEKTDEKVDKKDETAEKQPGDEKEETAEKKQLGDEDTPELSDEGKEKVEQMQKAYDDERTTAVLPGTDNTITGVAVNEWIDDDGNPKFGKDEQQKKEKDENSDQDDETNEQQGDSDQDKQQDDAG